MSRRLLPVSCAAVAVLGVGGCSGASSAQFATPSTAATGGASQSGAVASVVEQSRSLPDNATGAGQFVNLYFAAVNSAVATGDSRMARALVDPACGCLAGLDKVDQYSSTGQHITGAQLQLHNLIIDYRPVETVGSYYVTGTSGQLIDSAGGVISEIPTVPPVSFLIHLRRISDLGWRVVRLEQQ